MPVPTASPWLVNELGEPLCAVVASSPYSYAPDGSDLPRDHRVLQYYFNLGVQSCWQRQQVYPLASADAPYSYQHYPPYLSQEPPMHSAPVSFPETSRSIHQPPSSYPESSRAADGQAEGHGSGPPTSLEGPASSVSPAPPGSAPSSTLLYSDQTTLSPPPLLHLPYEAPPPAAYVTTAHLPHPTHPHPAHLPHHSSFHPFLPPSTHWGTLSAGHAPRVYCPAPNPTHVVGYITAPSSHHTATHYIPPSM